jgi:hypothetical protein
MRQSSVDEGEPRGCAPLGDQTPAYGVMVNEALMPGGGRTRDPDRNATSRAAGRVHVQNRVNRKLPVEVNNYITSNFPNI